MILHVCGKTEDGRLAIGGIYDFFATYGLPIDIIAVELRDRGMIIAWDAFYDEAANHGVGHRSAMLRMSEVLGNSAQEQMNALRLLWTEIDAQ